MSHKCYTKISQQNISWKSFHLNVSHSINFFQQNISFVVGILGFQCQH
jgi:hypothetical protein